MTLSNWSKKIEVAISSEYNYKAWSAIDKLAATYRTNPAGCVHEGIPRNEKFKFQPADEKLLSYARQFSKAITRGDYLEAKSLLRSINERNVELIKELSL